MWGHKAGLCHFPMLLLIAVGQLVPVLAISQTSGYGASGGCQVNTQSGILEAQGRTDLQDAVVEIKFSNQYSCSGLLVNRATEAGSMGFYVVSAHHCIHNPDVDFNAYHDVIFHFQSPTAESSDTPLSNRGLVRAQSVSLSPPSTPPDPANPRGFEYFHHTKLRLVDDVTWGDFILFEILTPVPPHYNVYYAGWNPSPLYGDGMSIGFPPPCAVSPNRFAVLHHAKSDIMKSSGTQTILNPQTPLFLGCDIVTTLVDALFGWIWGNSFSTQTICNYVDYPWLVAPYWCYGGIEPGSSGSGLLSPANRFIGPCSWDIFTCSDVATTNFGKFKNVYPRSAIKNTLNPSNDLGTDLWGIYGRRIECYENLELPGGYQIPTYYFPADHYQDENKIQLRAAGYVHVNHPITILSGADYEFKAGSQITLDPGFFVQNGANFKATIETCNTTRGMALAPGWSTAQDMEPLPRNQDEDRLSNSEVKSVSEDDLLLYPNPVVDVLNFPAAAINPMQIEVIEPDGRVAMRSFLDQDHLFVGQLSAGIYFIRSVAHEGAILGRFIKQ